MCIYEIFSYGTYPTYWRMTCSRLQARGALLLNVSSGGVPRTCKQKGKCLGNRGKANVSHVTPYGVASPSDEHTGEQHSCSPVPKLVWSIAVSQTTMSNSTYLVQAKVWEQILVDVFSPRSFIAGRDYVVTKWTLKRRVVCGSFGAIWDSQEGVASLC